MTEVKKFFSKDGGGHAWWSEMTPDSAGNIARKGDRAELRRCESPSEVMLQPSYYRVWFAATKAGAAQHTTNESQEAAMAFIAGILSHVTENSPKSFGEAMAQPKDPDNKDPKNQRSLVSGLRFRKLLEIQDADQLYVVIIRMIRMLGRTAPIAALANDLMRWNNDRSRDDVRRKWAREYYSTNPNEI